MNLGPLKAPGVAAVSAAGMRTRSRLRDVTAAASAAHGAAGVRGGLLRLLLLMLPDMLLQEAIAGTAWAYAGYALWSAAGAARRTLTRLRPTGAQVRPRRVKGRPAGSKVRPISQHLLPQAAEKDPRSARSCGCGYSGYCPDLPPRVLTSDAHAALYRRTSVLQLEGPVGWDEITTNEAQAKVMEDIPRQSISRHNKAR